VGRSSPAAAATPETGASLARLAQRSVDPPMLSAAVPTVGDRLAGITGALLAREPAGAEAVTFAGGAAESPPAPAPAPPTPAPAPTATTVADPGSPAPPGRPRDDGDELYERIIERLRRDLLAERERVGDLLGTRW
jgi:hypothetical protein